MQMVEDTMTGYLPSGWGGNKVRDHEISQIDTEGTERKGIRMKSLNLFNRRNCKSFYPAMRNCFTHVFYLGFRVLLIVSHFHYDNRGQDRHSTDNNGYVYDAFSPQSILQRSSSRTICF